MFLTAVVFLTAAVILIAVVISTVLFQFGSKVHFDLGDAYFLGDLSNGSL